MLTVLPAILLLPMFARAIESGSHLVFKARLLGCDQREYVVDYAEVPETGYISVLDGVKVSVVGLAEEEVAAKVAHALAERLGRTPKTLRVEVVPASRLKQVAEEFMAHAFSGPDCLHVPEEGPPLEKEYIRGLALAPPIIALHPSHDPVCLALALQAVCLKSV